MENLNIVELIEKNAMTRLSKNYENRLLLKIKNNFTDNQQQLFVASFYCYINHDSKKEFVIDFDNVWKWMGFTRKDNAKTCLEKYFTNNIDYQVKKAAPANSGAAFGGAGLNKEQIMLTINAFKKFCMKANTKKADEIHEYYIKLEELLQETLNEESDELKLQLTCKDEENKKLDEENKKLTKKYVKKTKQVFEDKNVVYLMTTEESEKVGEYVVGKATDLNSRKEDYDHNKLHDFKVIYYRSCSSTKLMDIIESSVLMKLGKYRCKAGRNVFLLPDLCDIKLFTNVFDNCMKFYEDVEYVIYPKRTLEKMDKDKMREKNEKYQAENKDKIKQKQKGYYEDNKELLSDIKKIYYEKNADEIGEKNKKYYEENKEDFIENNMEYYYENKEHILEDRKEFYKDNKEQILEERAKHYKDNYKTKIAPQRQKKEKCECGMVVAHYCMKKHKLSARHKSLMEKLI